MKTVILALMILASTQARALVLDCDQYYRSVSDWEPARSTIVGGRGTAVDLPKLDLWNRETGELVNVFDRSLPSILTRDVAMGLPNANSNALVLNPKCSVSFDPNRSPWAPGTEFLKNHGGLVQLARGTAVRYLNYHSAGGITADCLRMPLFHVTMSATVGNAEIPLLMTCWNTAPEAILTTFAKTASAPVQSPVASEYADRHLYGKRFVSQKPVTLQYFSQHWDASHTNADGIHCRLQAHRLSSADRYVTSAELPSYRDSFVRHAYDGLNPRSFTLPRGDTYEVGFLYGGQGVLDADVVNLNRRLYFKATCNGVLDVSKRKVEPRDIETLLKAVLE